MTFSIYKVSSRRAPRTPPIPWAYYAPTITAATPATITGWKTNHVEYKRRHIKTLAFGHNDEYPTNFTTDTAYWPAFRAQKANRVEFKRRLQVPTLGYYQPTATRLVAGAPIEPDVDRPLQSRRLLRPAPITFVAPQTFTAQSYPAWGVRQFRTEFKRRLQTVVLSSFPQLPPTPEQPPSAFRTHFEKTRQTKRTLRPVRQGKDAPTAAFRSYCSNDLLPENTI